MLSVGPVATEELPSVPAADPVAAKKKQQQDELAELEAWAS